MQLIISLSALLLSVMLVQMGIGALRPFDSISGAVLGFTSVDIGLVASGHFVGFLVGCLIGPKLVFRAGHSRAFAIFTACGVISIIAHTIYADAYYWTIARIFGGFAVAGCYTVIESWLQAKARNKIRARVFSIYRISDFAGQILANSLIGVLTPASYISYNMLAMIMCLALIPLAFTLSKEPALPKTNIFQPFIAYKVSPLATLGVVVAGVSSAAFGSIAPLFAKDLNMSYMEMSYFLTTAVVGGIVVHPPAGFLADHLDRRLVLMVFSVLSTIVCLAIGSGIVDLAAHGYSAQLLFAFLFGISTFPIYSLSAAHANDFAPPNQILNLSASLIFFYALGAIISPIIAGFLIGMQGTLYLFIHISMAHIVLIIFTIARSIARPVSKDDKPYVYYPRTTMFIANIIRVRNLKGKRDKH
ncbi:MAG: MFS transporter [Candidatus Puniceispirillum sp.]|nr:MFS transporter [Candidatus Puniceispirillum sp.]